MLYKWAEKGNFVWLVTEDILDEYKEVLKRLRVRSTLIGAVINLIRERAEPVNDHALPIPRTIRSVSAAKKGMQISLSP